MSTDTVLVSGSTGFLGRALVARLRAAGHRIRRLVRGQAANPDDVAWNPSAGRLDAASLVGVTAVVNLAGEPIDRRWTAERRRAIRESRVGGTSLLARTMAAMPEPPRVLVSASAVGYYGDRGDEPLNESSAPGHGFLAEVVVAWERAADPARERGIRVIHPRFGLIMNAEGGVLARLLPIFRLGAGGRIGSGQQMMSWIARDDVLAAIEFLLATGTMAGPVNVTSPSPVTNAEFAGTLAHVLHRPALAAVPELAVRFAFGEMGQETILAGQRVLPQALLEHGFQFGWPTLEQALRHETG